jgi:hypothetical protein
MPPQGSPSSNDLAFVIPEEHAPILPSDTTSTCTTLVRHHSLSRRTRDNSLLATAPHDSVPPRLISLHLDKSCYWEGDTIRIKVRTPTSLSGQLRVSVMGTQSWTTSTHTSNPPERVHMHQELPVTFYHVHQTYREYETALTLPAPLPPSYAISSMGPAPSWTALTCSSGTVTCTDTTAVAHSRPKRAAQWLFSCEYKVTAVFTSSNNDTHVDHCIIHVSSRTTCHTDTHTATTTTGAPTPLYLCSRIPMGSLEMAVSVPTRSLLRGAAWPITVTLTNTSRVPVHSVRLQVRETLTALAPHVRFTQVQILTAVTVVCDTTLTSWTVTMTIPSKARDSFASAWLTVEHGLAVTAITPWYVNQGLVVLPVTMYSDAATAVEI